MANDKISMLEVVDMVRHWLATPVNGYLGSSYGQDVKALLQQSMATGVADAFITKMITDVPILASMPAGTVNIYTSNIDRERQRLIIDLAGNQVTVDSAGNVS